MLYCHGFFDFIVACDRALPELPRIPSPAPGVPVLVVRFDAPQGCGQVIDLEPWPDDAGRVLQGRAGDAIRIRVLGLADFLVRPALAAVECHGLPDANPSDVRHFLLNQILPRLVGDRSPLVLHAGGVLTDLGAIALVGPSGIGKSTLAASFGASGEARVLADDAVRIMDDGAGVRLIGAYGAFRLRPDSRVALRLPGEGPLVGPGKTILAAPRGAAIGEGSHPLAAVFMLQASAAGGSAITALPLSGAPSVLGLIRHVFFLDPGDPALIRRQFEAVGSLVLADCGLYTLDYPRRFGVLPQVRAKIIAALHERAGRGLDQCVGALEG